MSSNDSTVSWNEVPLLLCLYVADPATLLASDSILGTLFSTENGLFILQNCII